MKKILIIKKIHDAGVKLLDSRKDFSYEIVENLDTKFVAIHDYFKYLKFGYGRATDQASIEIHHGRMDRNTALSKVNDYDGKLPTKYLDEFLETMGITREQFDQLCAKFRK